jgi:hypothetical protein
MLSEQVPVSGSIGFWATRIRIRNYLHELKKTLDFYSFVPCISLFNNMSIMFIIHAKFGPHRLLTQEYLPGTKS